MDQHSNTDFRSLYTYRFEELLMLFRRNGQSLTDGLRNVQSNPVIDICGSDFREYRRVIATNESWVVYSIEKLIMGMLDTIGINYAIPHYNEISSNGKKKTVRPFSFVKLEGDRTIAYIIRNKQMKGLIDLRAEVRKYPEIDGAYVCYLNSRAEQIKLLNDSEREEDHSFLRFLTLKDLFDEQFGETEFPVFLEYANNFNERARNLIGYKMMAIPTSDAISRFKSKTVLTLKEWKYDEMWASLLDKYGYNLDQEQYDIIYRNYIGRGMFELMVESTDFGDSFISSEWYFNIHTITGAIDQTGVATGYLKSVEQLLYSVLKLYMDGKRRIGISGTKRNGFSGTIYNGKYIDFVQTNESSFDKTLGSLIRFIKSKYNADLFDVNSGTIQFLIEELYKFKNFERNDHLHKDNLYTLEKLQEIRDSVIFLYFLILGSFSITDTDLVKIGKTPQPPEQDILIEEDLEKKIVDWATPIICYDVPKNTKVLVFMVQKSQDHQWQLILQGLEGIDKEKYSTCEWNHRLSYSSIMTNNILSWKMSNDWSSGVDMIINALAKLAYMDTALGKMLRSFPEIVLGSTGVIRTIYMNKQNIGNQG